LEDINNLTPSKQIGAIYFFIKRYPFQTLIQTFVLIFAGFAEAISLITLLPILNIAIKGEVERSTTLGKWILSFFDLISSTPTLSNLLILFVSLVFLKSILLFISMKKVGEIAANIAEDLRTQIIENLLKIKWSFFIQQKTGDLAAAMTTESEKSASLFILTGRVASFFFQVLIYLFFAFQTSGLATLSAVLVSGILIFGLRKLISLSRQAGAKQTKTQTVLLLNVSESFSSFKLIKAMGLESIISKSFYNDIKALSQISIKKVISKEGVKNSQEPVYTLAIALGIFYSIKFSLFLTVESLFIVVLLFYRTVQRLGELQKSYQSLVLTTPGFYFVQNLINSCKNAVELETKGEKFMFQDKITLQNLSFSYGKNQILEGITAEIPYGKFVSFYGGSGTGKTTTVDLIVGLLNPKSGKILIDGKNLNDLDGQTWKNQISYVSQDSFLFNDTIRNNITFKDPHHSDDEIIQALKDAEAWSFIKDLPNKLDTIVEERGGNFSGGQKQRLTIARALFRKPRLIILDESTTALDPKTEKEIIQTLLKLSGKTTILAISHQKAIKDASEIVYKLEHKKIIKL
jgi:ATP-binding cassette subfamily C protein